MSFHDNFQNEGEMVYYCQNGSFRMKQQKQTFCDVKCELKECLENFFEFGNAKSSNKTRP